VIILFYCQIQHLNVSLNFPNIQEGLNTYSPFIEQVKSDTDKPKDFQLDQI